MNKEYLLHGTQVENAIRILQQKKILANPPKKYKVMLADWEPTKQIFTQLIYKDIPNQENYIPHWGQIAFVLSKELLKDYPFYATRVGKFLNNFEDAFSNTDTETVENKEDIIIKSPKGGLSRMPNLAKLRNYINEHCKIRNLSGLDFMHSNEILFNRDILLDKYCIALIADPYVDDKENRELEQLCSQLNIPYHRIEKIINRKDRHKLLGLNKFVELVDKVISNKMIK